MTCAEFFVAYPSARHLLPERVIAPDVAPFKIVGFEPNLRFCVACSAGVTNLNLGGYTGHSALTGQLYCLRCADVERARS
jgi:hypothetical protein